MTLLGTSAQANSLAPGTMHIEVPPCRVQEVKASYSATERGTEASWCVPRTMLRTCFPSSYLRAVARVRAIRPCLQVVACLRAICPVVGRTSDHTISPQCASSSGHRSLTTDMSDAGEKHDEPSPPRKPRKGPRIEPPPSPPFSGVGLKRTLVEPNTVPVTDPQGNIVLAPRVRKTNRRIREASRAPVPDSTSLTDAPSEQREVEQTVSPQSQASLRHTLSEVSAAHQTTTATGDEGSKPDSSKSADDWEPMSYSTLERYSRLGTVVRPFKCYV